MKVRLTKKFRPDVAGGPRTDIIEGECSELPAIDKSFRMVAPPLVAGDIRYVETSMVKSITAERGTGYSFTTQTGSIYLLEVL